MSNQPVISVVIPTFRRPTLLCRAVVSVLSQDFQGWELIISDDEARAGESFERVSALAASDLRVRIVRNVGTHGQAANTNHGMSLARGEWIKLLHDDDTLEPRCLSVMIDAARRSPTASIVQCLAKKVDDLGRHRDELPGKRARVEELDGRAACLAMYLQDFDIGVPSQVMVRGRHVHAGAWFPTHPTITTGIDVLWAIELLSRGGIVLVNETLVEHRLDGHATATSTLGEDGFYRECEMLREVIWPLIESERPPSLESVRQMLKLIRAALNVHRGHPLHGLAIASRCWHAEGWWLACRWALRRSFPGMFESVPRRVLAR